MSNAIPLPARLDVDAACDLWARINATGGRLPLDAGALRHVGAAGLQLLLMADRLARGQGAMLALVNLPDAARDQLSRLGAADLATMAKGWAE